MYEYMIGKIVEQESNYIVLETGKIGYAIYVANPYAFLVDSEIKVYLYHHVREDEISLYGFKSKEEKDLFLRLTSVKGVGCKTALPILATGSIPGIIDAIERENILYLKKFPKIGEKVARQIILDLKGKLVSKEQGAASKPEHEELIEALKALGYKLIDITRIMPKVPNDLTIEQEIKEALKLLLK